MDEITFGEVIRSIRKAKGMTQEEVAEGICSTSSLSKMENGSQVPSRQRFQKIMERLGEPAILMPIFFSSGEAERTVPQGKHWRHWRAEEWSVPRNFCCGGKGHGFGGGCHGTAVLADGGTSVAENLRGAGAGVSGKMHGTIFNDPLLLLSPEEVERDNFTRTETLLLNNAGLGFLWEKTLSGGGGRLSAALQHQ